MRRRADRARASAWWLKEGKEKDDKEEKDRDEEEEEEEDREEDAEEVEEQDDERYRSDPYRPDRYGTEPRTIALQMMANAGIRKEDGALALAAVPENPGNTEMCASVRRLLCQLPPPPVLIAGGPGRNVLSLSGSDLHSWRWSWQMRQETLQRQDEVDAEGCCIA